MFTSSNSIQVPKTVRRALLVSALAATAGQSPGALAQYGEEHIKEVVVTGVLTADLRGLGAVRTLVLVDCRRFVPDDVTGLVDLETIPTCSSSESRS